MSRKAYWRSDRWPRGRGVRSVGNYWPERSDQRLVWRMARIRVMTMMMTMMIMMTTLHS